MRVFAVLSLLLAIQGPSSAPEVERLDPEHRALVEDFEAGSGRARLLTILSPT